MEISERLRVRRRELGKTQEEVARDAEMNVTQYNGYERGRSIPSSVTLPRLAKALSTTPEALSGGHSAERPGHDAAKGPVLRRLRSQFHAQIAAELDLAPEDISIRIEFL